MTNPRAQLHARLKELLSQCEWDALDKQPNDNAVLPFDTARLNGAPSRTHSELA